MRLRPPAPYYGSKAKVAHHIWEAFGDVANYVEPFCGLASTLLARPLPVRGVETLNDAHSFIPNLWRALREAPDQVADWADMPVHEAELHAVHRWLLEQADEDFSERMRTDPDFFDAKVAGRWVWGASAWLGSGWCSGGAPWQRRPNLKGACGEPRHGLGVHAGTMRKLPALGGSSGYPKPGVGLNRPTLHQSLPVLRGGGGRGCGYGNGVHSSVSRSRIPEYFRELQARLRYVRVTCGDWSRVVTDSVTISHGTAAVLLDPPYGAAAGRKKDLYAVDDLEVAESVRRWALERASDERFRIILCGLEGEHEMPADWRVIKWTSSVNSKNSDRERLWLSPSCRERPQLGLDFDTPARGATG